MAQRAPGTASAAGADGSIVVAGGRALLYELVTGETAETRVARRRR